MAVVARSNEFGVIRGEGEVSDTVVVCLNDFYIVKIRLPILYNAVLISRDKPVVAVRVLGCPDGRLMGL